MTKTRTLLLALIILVLAGCDGEPAIEDRLPGSWKNGDGNLIRFDADGAAAVGQEGLSGEGACRYEVRGDTIVVTMIAEEETEAYVVYRMRLDGDTLRINSLERHVAGEVSAITVEQYARQVGRPLYKLDFLREKEKKI